MLSEISSELNREKAELNISVTFRHTDSTQALKNYAVEKIAHVANKFISAAADAHVILTVEKRDHIAEVNFHSGKFDITANVSDVDLYVAIDRVCDSLEAQLRKQKEKFRGSPCVKQATPQ